MKTRTQLQAKAASPAAFTPVQTGLLQRTCACGGTPGLTGECGECSKNKLNLQRRVAPSPHQGEGWSMGQSAPPIVHEVLRSSGQPLDSTTRALFEPRFGYDFSQIRIHTDARAVESAQAVNALAYTIGRHVVFGARQYAPGSREGKRLLTHELTHVVQQGLSSDPTAGTLVIGSSDSAYEREAAQTEPVIDSPQERIELKSSAAQRCSHMIQRVVRPENVTCHDTGLTNPNLTGDEAVAAIQAAETEAITLARRAELLLDVNLLFTQAGEPVDAEFDTTLQEELGLTLTNPAHFRLIEQQRDRFQRVRETLESGYLRYWCRAETVRLVGCSPAPCDPNFARSCPANRLMALCQAFWDDPSERAGTILHEPFHILFSMLFHRPDALRRADASCFEAFARRLAGEAVSFSCVGHTAG